MPENGTDHRIDEEDGPASAHPPFPKAAEQHDGEKKDHQGRHEDPDEDDREPRSGPGARAAGSLNASAWAAWDHPFNIFSASSTVISPESRRSKTSLLSEGGLTSTKGSRAEMAFNLFLTVG